ncbi:hypothetical protein CRG98_008813 [Punica granatum]|uniref:PRP1 splicing factor N-terminal domain-containing protein n=1 Tax=Punica granatum TaxID=22663 RepID=A0A2I0KR69_PUNGR|nr:hypothetical protein CRG98_008813 [Punica granatum]
MPPRRTANQRRVAEEDELDRRIEQIIDIRLVVALECRLDMVVDRLGEKIGALMEGRHEVDPRRGRVPNPTTDLEVVEYDSYSEGDATKYVGGDHRRDRLPTAEIDQRRWEMGLRTDISNSKGARSRRIFVAGGDGEPEFDEEEEIVTGDGMPNLEWLKKGGDILDNDDSRTNSLNLGENDAAEDKLANWYLEKNGSDDPVSRETASGAKLTAFGYEKMRFKTNFIV